MNRERATGLLPAKLARQLQYPARVVAAAFGTVLTLGTLLLALPVATERGDGADPITALFTATSAVCVIGLIVVDTSSHWSTFGELVILGLVQVGGFGVMTLATLFGLLTARRLGLRARLWAQAETRSVGPGDVRRVVFGVALFSLVFEVAVAVLLAGRFALGYGEPAARAAYLGIFHAVSAFNNAGFTLYPDSLTRFVADPWVCLPIAAAVIVGGLGFPVLLELRRGLRRGRRRPLRWSLHTKLTLGVSGVLLLVGTVALTATEWTNPDTLGRLPAPVKLMAGFLHGGVMPRSGGLNSVDVGELHSSTLLGLDVLMFIGGGSASTAGGIKVTTFALLGFVILAELRGEPEVNLLGRRLPGSIQRQALTVALVSVGAVVAGTMVLLMLTPHRLDEVLFEVVSAFATVGLSTGITGELGPAAHVILVVLMFVGRLGPVTLGTALALRGQTRHYQLPEERPIVG